MRFPCSVSTDKTSEDVTVSVNEKGWLSTTEASDRLGVHPTTLRRWVDAGNIPCFRTPGGHRRFRAADLAAWMEGRQSAALTAPSEGLVQNVVGFTRHEMAERHVAAETWYVAFDRDQERQHMRETGRRLLGLAIQYMGRTSNHEPVLQEGRRIGDSYGRRCAEHGMSLVDTVRAFFFFRESLLQAIRSGLVTRGQYDAEDVRMHRQLWVFLDEVMYACLASYEAACRRVLWIEGAT
jgi:excisionase family DNA binding protein